MEKKSINEEKYSLKWNSHNSIITNNVLEHLTGEELCDVTLSCGGKFIKAHKLILSASSKYFKELFQVHKDRNPIIILANVQFEFIQCIVDYIYKGEMKLKSTEIEDILKLGNDLKIKGLQGVLNKNFQIPEKQVGKPLEKNEDLKKNPEYQEKQSPPENQLSESPISVDVVTRDTHTVLKTVHQKNGDAVKTKGTEKFIKQIGDSTVPPKKKRIIEVRNLPKDKQAPTMLRPILPKLKSNEVMNAMKLINLPNPQAVAEPTNSQNISPRVHPKIQVLPALVPLLKEDLNATTKEGTGLPNQPKIDSQTVTNSTSHKRKLSDESPMLVTETKPQSLKLTSAFMLFAEKHRPKVSSDYPDESIKEISLRLSRIWKNLTNNEKDSFYIAASEENEKRRKMMKT